MGCPVLVTVNADRMHACNKPGPAGAADRCGGKKVCVAYGLAGKLIQVGCCHGRVAIAAKVRA